MTDNLRTFLTALAELMEKHSISLEAVDSSWYGRAVQVSSYTFNDDAILGDYVTSKAVLQHLEDVQ
jgi:hypothetical protein